MAGNENSGRKANSENAAQAKMILHEAAPDSARYVAAVAKGDVKNPSRKRMDACFDNLNRTLGKPPMAIEAKVGLSPESEEYIDKLLELGKRT